MHSTQCSTLDRLISLTSLSWLCLAVLCLTSCPSSKLPPDPGLIAEDFGTGVRLCQSLAEAELALATANGWEVWLLSRDEFHDRNPYAEHSGNKDLLVALYMPMQTDSGALQDSSEQEVINELRVYLAPPGTSKLRFRGELLAQLSKSEMIDLLGQPATPVVGSNDGQEHLTYYFTLPDKPHTVLKLVSSHYLPEQSCRSVLLTLVTDPS